MSKRIAVLLAIIFLALISGIGLWFWRAASSPMFIVPPKLVTTTTAEPLTRAPPTREARALADPVDTPAHAPNQTAKKNDAGISLASPQAADEIVAPETVSLEVLVIDVESATPVQDAMVELLRVDPKVSTSSILEDVIETSSPTGPDGRVRFTTSPGSIGVVARTAQSSTLFIQRNLAAGKHELTIELHHHLQFIFSVRSDATGEPIEGAHLQVRSQRLTTENERGNVQYFTELTTGVDGQVAITVSTDANLEAFIHKEGYVVEQRKLAAREAFGEVRLLAARKVSVRMPVIGRSAVVSLRQPNLRTVSRLRNDDAAPHEVTFASATEVAGDLVIDPGEPFAVEIVELPAGGDQTVDLQPRTDGGAITLTMAAAFNGSVRVYLKDFEVRELNTQSIAAGESLVIDRLAPDLDYKVVLFIAKDEAGNGKRVNAGTIHVTPSSNTVIEISSTMLDPAVPETR